MWTHSQEEASRICEVKVFTNLHVLFPVVIQWAILTLGFIWLVYGLIKRRFTRIFSYSLYYPHPLPSEALTTLYFVRIFFSQRTSNFLNSTRISIQFHYTDMTSFTVNCEPEILVNALKYRNDSCCNLYVYSPYHVGQLDGVALDHDSDGTFMVEIVEVQRLDNDPKTRFIAEIGDQIRRMKNDKRKKYLFDDPEEMEPDYDVRPTNTVTLFEIVPFTLFTVEIGSLFCMGLLEKFCTTSSDPTETACTRVNYICLGIFIGVLIFVILLAMLYIYTSFVRKGLHNNLGMDWSNIIRLVVIVLMASVGVHVGIKVLSDAYSEAFKLINSESQVLNCDQSYALTAVTAFFVFYFLLGLTAPLYIIYRTNYENKCITLEEQSRRRLGQKMEEKLVLTPATDDKEVKPRKRIPEPPSSPTLPATTTAPPPSVSAPAPSTSPHSMPKMIEVKNKTPETSNSTPKPKAMPVTKNIPKAHAKAKMAKSGIEPDDEEEGGGYFGQMMKMDKIRSISQYALKKR